MKNNKKIVKIKQIAILLICLILCLSAFETTAFAIAEPCVLNHFSNLDFSSIYEGPETRTPPSMNSCPYTAMSMLLSFYDTYWNDRFVDEKYEWQDGMYSGDGDFYGKPLLQQRKPKIGKTTLMQNICRQEKKRGHITESTL